MEKKIIRKVYNINVRRKGLGTGDIRLAFFSDLHNCENGRNNEKLFALLDEMQPDLVLSGGDIPVSRPGMSLEPALSFMERLAETYTVVCANGNHEYRMKLYPEVYGDMAERYFGALRRLPVTLLENQDVKLQINGIPLRICGYEMDREYYKRFSRQELPVSEISQYFGGPSKEEYTILLAHHPGYRKTYLEWGADLTLSGHYHGGVMRLGAHRGIITPDFRIFNDKCYGRYDREGQTALVTSGAGEHTIPLRLFNPRELVEIHLKFTREERAKYGNPCKTAGI